MAEELSAEEKQVLAERQEEAAYGRFKAWLDRYAEENKPAPEKTDKGDKPRSIMESLFGGN